MSSNNGRLCFFLKNSPIDHLIREANVAFGFGQRPSDTYVVHAGKPYMVKSNSTDYAICAYKSLFVFSLHLQN